MVNSGLVSYSVSANTCRVRQLVGGSGQVTLVRYDAANRLMGLVQGTAVVSYGYNGLGERVRQVVDGQSTSYTLDVNAGLTQVLGDGTYTYLYGVNRVSQTAGSLSEYSLGDALGSVRQLVDGSGQVTLAQSYTPYGEVLASEGSRETAYAFTGEMYDPGTGLVYLRARYYAPYLNQFIQPDSIVPEPRSPQAWNRYLYSVNNPVNYTDPTGYFTCQNPLSASCQIGLAYVNGFASTLKGLVTSGAVEPVEAFATFADLSKSRFDGNIRDQVWAMTIVLNDFDANRGMISTQVFGSAESPYYIHQDWLRYKNNPDYDDPSWGAGEEGTWIHSLRGDWSEKYWDKTANQAYHFWGLLAITFFDGYFFGDTANWQHDGNYLWQQQENYDFSHSDPNKAPPPSGISKPDYDLSLRAISLGDQLRREAYFQDNVFHGCEEQWKFVGYTDIGQWIRANLKG
jgi:RHS repeat-associated protein